MMTECGNVNEECGNVKMWKCENSEGQPLVKIDILFVIKDRTFRIFTFPHLHISTFCHHHIPHICLIHRFNRGIHLL